jgi:hypothetical protein
MFRACAEVRHGMASVLCWADVMCQVCTFGARAWPLDASQLVRAAARLGHRHEAMFRACEEVRHVTSLMSG